MANRYANLVGSNKIKDEYTKINEGFDKVEQEMDAKPSASIAQVNTIALDADDTLNVEGGTGITVVDNPEEKKIRIVATGETTPGPHGDEHDHDGADPIPELIEARNDLASRAINVKYPPAPLVAPAYDGVTDDSAVIAAIIDYLGETGGVLYFPIGKCMVKNTISVPSNIWLIGNSGGSERAESSVIITDQPIDIFSISGSPQPTNIKFQALVLDGGLVGERGINVENGIIYWEDCFFERFTVEALRLNNAYTSFGFRSFFRQNVLGINFGENANSISILKHRMLSNSTAMSFTSSAHMVSINGTSIENGTDGIIIGAGDVDGLTITQCYFEAMTGSHIKSLAGTSPVRNLTIMDNHFHGSSTTAYCVDLAAGNGIELRRNNMFSYTTAAVRIASDTTRVLLSSNYREYATFPIDVEDNSKKAIVETWSSGYRTTNQWVIEGAEQGFNNLINNGSFEFGTSGWTASAATLSISTTKGVVEGTSALLITPSSNVNGRVEQNINVDMKYAIGRMMSFSAYIELGTSTSVRFRVTTNTGNVASLFVTQSGYYSISGVIPADSTSITVSFYADTVFGTGTAYIDAVSANFGAIPIRYSVPVQKRRGGTTAQRPTAPDIFEHYFDTTLGKPIWWNGTNWKDASGTNV